MDYRGRGPEGTPGENGSMPRGDLYGRGMESDAEQSIPMMPPSGFQEFDNQPPGGFSNQVKQAAKMGNENPNPGGFLAWCGFGCTIFALATLCISFSSPYWLQAYPNSFNTFRNIGLWEVCMDNYMHHKDDSQEIYSGCWWVFSRDKKYWKLREWLLPPWFISCQVMVVGCLILEIGTLITAAMIFLHICPILNHEYFQTYAMFGASALMFLVTMITFIAGTVFAEMCQDWQWMPRPDMNLLSWGYGFFIISGMAAIAAGVCFYLEAKKVYEELIRKEDEYNKMAFSFEMSNYAPSVGTMGTGYATKDPYPPTAYDSSYDQKYPADQYDPGYAQPQGYVQPQGYQQPGYTSNQPPYYDQYPEKA